MMAVLRLSSQKSLLPGFRSAAHNKIKDRWYVAYYRHAIPAVFDGKRRSTLRSAIAEAAYLTALERHLRPVSDSMAIAPIFNYEAPANSLTVLRIKSRETL